MTHWSQFLFTFYTCLPTSPHSSTPTHHQASPMTSPALRPSLLVPQQHPNSTVSLSQSPLLTKPVCPQMLEQYRSVRLAQGVGGLRRVSPGFLTMLWQKRQREGARENEGREESLTDSTRRILPLAPPNPTPFPWPVAPNKHLIYLADTRPQWVGPLSHSGRLTLNNECGVCLNWNEGVKETCIGPPYLTASVISSYIPFRSTQWCR